MRYDRERVTRVVQFFEGVLRHPKDRYSPFILLPWELDYIKRTFGMVDEDGLRIIRRSYLELGKKNGKSELAAGIALYMLAADGEPAAEVYLAATAKEQAGIVFRTAAAMVNASPVLHRAFKVIRSTKVIVSRTSPDTFLRAISADGDAQDGINPHGVIIDELHRWKTARSQELINVLIKGMVARKQPLALEITTAGSTQDESPLAWLEHERTRSIECGDFTDPSFYGKIYSADPTDDWTKPETWAKANPSLDVNGGFLKSEVIGGECLAAVNQPSLQAAFKRYHLGIWLSTETEYIPREAWKACTKERRALTERACYLGLDLSETTDLTSLVALFPSSETDGSVSFDVLPFFWMAKDRIRERELADRVPYGMWVQQGLLEATEGDVIDLRDIKKKIAWMAEVFQVTEVAFDPFHAMQLSIELSEELGLKCVPVPQRFTHMSEPTKKLMELVLGAKLRTEDHKILTWNMHCLRVRGDGNDNIRPTKPERFKSGKRVDGAVATILALSRAMFHRPSIYETQGLTTVAIRP